MNKLNIALIVNLFLSFILLAMIGFHAYQKHQWQKEAASTWFDYFYTDCKITMPLADVDKRAGLLVQGNYQKQRYFIYDFQGNKHPAEMEVLTDGTLDIRTLPETDPNYELVIDFKNNNCQYYNASYGANHYFNYYEGKLGKAVQSRGSKIEADLIHDY